MKLLRHSCFALALLCAPVPAFAFSNSDVVDGFNKTVFGAEYSSFSLSAPYVRKFPGIVRIYVTSSVGSTRKKEAERFALSLNKFVRGLRVQLVSSERKANFVVRIVSRRGYESTVRKKILRNSNAEVRGKCMVRAVFSRRGISRSDAVIVGNEGDRLFQRCMTEEILQGLGPLNDNRSLPHSMFNDTSNFTSFRRYDRLILNMLYDRRIKNGMSQRAAAPLLSTIISDVRNRIEGR